MIELTILAVVLLAGVAAGIALRYREGRVRTAENTEIAGSRTELLSAVGVTEAVPTVLHFSAEWCGPCKMIAPILDEVSRDYADKLNVAKVNVDENQEIASKYGILGIPTLMLFRNGAVVATKVGALSKSQLTAFLDSNL